MKVALCVQVLKHLALESMTYQCEVKNTLQRAISNIRDKISCKACQIIL